MWRITFSMALLGFWVWPNSAYANDSAKADALFDEGVANMKAGDYAKGCPQIRASLYIEHLPGALYTLALCEHLWGHWVGAQALYKRFLEYCETLPPNEKAGQQSRIDDALVQLEQLAKDIPRLTLSLEPDVPKGTVVKLDQKNVDKATIGTEVLMSPGTYVASTQAPGGPKTEKIIVLVKGQRSAVVLPIARPESAKMHPRVVASLVALGVFGASLGFGVVASVAADEKGNRLANMQQDDPEYQVISNQMNKFEITSLVSAGIAAASMSTMVIVLLTVPSSAPPTKTAHHPDIHFGLLRANSTSVMGGFYGTW